MGLTINQTEDPNTSSSRCAVIHAPPQLLLDGRNNFSSKISKDNVTFGGIGESRITVLILMNVHLVTMV